ncbi:unnamed protein product [Gordionus sp. m RMFG-2023]
MTFVINKDDEDCLFEIDLYFFAKATQISVINGDDVNFQYNYGDYLADVIFGDDLILTPRNLGDTKELGGFKRFSLNFEMDAAKIPTRVVVRTDFPMTIMINKDNMDCILTIYWYFFAKATQISVVNGNDVNFQYNNGVYPTQSIGGNNLILTPGKDGTSEEIGGFVRFSLDFLMIRNNIPTTLIVNQYQKQNYKYGFHYFSLKVASLISQRKNVIIKDWNKK